MAGGMMQMYRLPVPECMLRQRAGRQPDRDPVGRGRWFLRQQPVAPADVVAPDVTGQVQGQPAAGAGLLHGRVLRAQQR